MYDKCTATLHSQSDGLRRQVIDSYDTDVNRPEYFGLGTNLFKWYWIVKP